MDTKFTDFVDTLLTKSRNSDRLMFFSCSVCDLLMELAENRDVVVQAFVLAERLPLMVDSVFVVLYFLFSHTTLDMTQVMQIDLLSVLNHFFLDNCVNNKGRTVQSQIIEKYIRYKNRKTHMMRNRVISEDDENAGDDKEEVKILKKEGKSLLSLVKKKCSTGVCFGFDESMKTRCIYSSTGVMQKNYVLQPTLKIEPRWQSDTFLKEMLFEEKKGEQVFLENLECDESFSGKSTEDSDYEKKMQNAKKFYRLVSSEKDLFNFGLTRCPLCVFSIIPRFRLELEDFVFCVKKTLRCKNLIKRGVLKKFGSYYERLFPAGNVVFTKINAVEAERKSRMTESLTRVEVKAKGRRCVSGGADQIKPNPEDTQSFQFNDRLFSINALETVFTKWFGKFSLNVWEKVREYCGLTGIFNHVNSTETVFCAANTRRVFHDCDEIAGSRHSCLLPVFLDLGTDLVREKYVQETELLNSNVFTVAQSHFFACNVKVET